MRVLHTRTQHPVGQGFFHSGKVTLEGRHLHYVYDCGALREYGAARSNAIRGYVSSLKRRKRIDLLFVSHAHADHVNGLPDLLASVTPETVVLPLMEPEDRLVALGRAAADGEDLGSGSFLASFLSDPVGHMLGVSGVTCVIVVRRSERRRRDGDVPRPVLLSDARGLWTLEGPAVLPSPSSSSGHDDRVVHVSDDSLFSTQMDHHHLRSWLLVPYVDVPATTDRERFRQEVRAAFGRGAAAPLDDALLRDILADKDGPTRLKHAYEVAIEHAGGPKDLNLTSLCVYSGPTYARPTSAVLRACCPSCCDICVEDRPRARKRRCAWLGTGDARLADDRQIARFAKHFGSRLDTVSTLTLPHHGSRRSVGEALIAKVAPIHCVASADAHGPWQHPSPEVVRMAGGHGASTHLVTSAPRSKWTETVATW